MATSSKAVVKYRKKTYDAVQFLIKKGEREHLKEHAERMGESLSEFIKRAIERQIEEDEKSGKP